MHFTNQEKVFGRICFFFFFIFCIFLKSWNWKEVCCCCCCKQSMFIQHIYFLKWKERGALQALWDFYANLLIDKASRALFMRSYCHIHPWQGKNESVCLSFFSDQLALPSLPIYHQCAAHVPLPLPPPPHFQFLGKKIFTFSFPRPLIFQGKWSP